MKILFLTTAHNSLSQRLLIELTDRGHEIAVTLASSEEAMLKGVAENEPELIIAPMLKASIPKRLPTGISASSSIPESWATAGRLRSTGRSQRGRGLGGIGPSGREERDAGPISAREISKSRSPPIPKSQLYRQEVTEAAVAAVLGDGGQPPTPRFRAVTARLFPPRRARDLAASDAPGRPRHRLEPR